MPQSPTPQSPTLRERFRAWLLDNADNAILRWLFRGIVMVTLAALAIDLAGMEGWIPDSAAAPAEVTEDSPRDSPGLNFPNIVPAILAPFLPGGDKWLMPQPDGTTAHPMTFELVGRGKLMATGTITLGISEVFAAEVDRRGEYIKTVVLNSAGGSVTDALAMGRLIRQRKFATEVEPGRYCVSSCPLVFAGGIERRAGDRATIGVHQVAAIRSAGNGPPRDEMSFAQNISARCQRYLDEMGVSPQVWMHAMETPHDKLFVLKPDELRSLNLVTAVPGAAPATAKKRS